MAHRSVTTSKVQTRHQTHATIPSARRSLSIGKTIEDSLSQMLKVNYDSPISLSGAFRIPRYLVKLPLWGNQTSQASLFVTNVLILTEKTLRTPSPIELCLRQSPIAETAVFSISACDTLVTLVTSKCHKGLGAVWLCVTRGDFQNRNA